MVHYAEGLLKVNETYIDIFQNFDTAFHDRSEYEESISCTFPLSENIIFFVVKCLIKLAKKTFVIRHGQTVESPMCRHHQILSAIICF